MDALNPEIVDRSKWVTENHSGDTGPHKSKALALRDDSILNTLSTLVKAELKALATHGTRIPTSQIEEGMDQSNQLMMALALGGRGLPRGVNLSSFPGLIQGIAETKRVRREQLRQALTKVGLDTLFDEILPGEPVMIAIDNGLASGTEHVAVSINDLVELFDEWTPESETGMGGAQVDENPQVKKPPKGEAWGLSHHLLKLLVFMIGLRLREKVDESHVYNLLYFVLKHYRSEGNKEGGMHYAQALFNRLHKKSWWKTQGTLKTHLESVNKDVLESLRLKYPKVDRPPPPKGKDSFRKGGPGGKRWTPTPQ